ncbi:L-lactate dehydrogenase [Limosilactobacillus albertensis]|uniref:L-lactate dehydrogenase n=1 Tax=Limosilactobacillus albertensis TaxID=2759752 RepID=A0A839HAB6_9LACO|nr:L-lactate dehydrogenase [Limosilactobacillus albertensis]MBB1123669.1 L-lactate dehydrogenase [Limosilactobacillus albertensis]MCD7121541.1 L-lactate dehydrogenase [Limosilactobacillus albertensis]
MLRHHHKVLLVGDGAVGSSFAFSLLQTTQEVDELVIVDLKKDKATGESLDLQDITPLTSPVNIHAGDYSDATDADVVVITAGVPRKPGETRLDLVNKNAKILSTIVTPIVESGFSGIFVVSSNPVDILTTLTQKLSGFPKHRVIGTGTSLDTARLDVLLSEKLDLPVNEIDAFILGEHGDTSFGAFDEATVNGKPLKEVANLTDQDYAALEKAVKARGSEIINGKGATFYGVAKYLAYIVRAIIENRNVMLPVSVPLTGQYGIKDLYLGLPAIINRTGIERVVDYDFSEAELKKLTLSATKMKEVLDNVEL